jgi:hypothetical protein
MTFPNITIDQSTIKITIFFYATIFFYITSYSIVRGEPLRHYNNLIIQYITQIIINTITCSNNYTHIEKTQLKGEQYFNALASLKGRIFRFHIPAFIKP